MNATTNSNNKTPTAKNTNKSCWPFHRGNDSLRDSPQNFRKQCAETCQKVLAREISLYAGTSTRDTRLSQ